jgi:tetratricopeptide (TPR) repeat protein
VLTSSQRYADAIAQLELAVKAQPQEPGPYLTLGALHLELKHPVEGEAALKRFVELATPPAGERAASDDGRPDDRLEQAWLMLAQAAEMRGDFKAAEGWLARIADPERALDVQTRRATILAREGRLREARALIKALPERDAEEARAKLSAEAGMLREVKRWKEAYEVLGQAVQRFADDTELLYEQAMMAEKLDRLAEMEQLLRRVIALKPDNAHAYNALGYSLADRSQRLPEARTLIAKALELSPGDPFITDSLGWVEFRLGNRDEALRLLRQAYAARPDAEIGAHLGEVLWSLNQRDEARRVWQESRRRDAANEVLRETLARLRVDL